MQPFSFRQKVLFAAVALVTVIQLGTLIPVLRTIEQDAEQQARRTVSLAGVVFDDFMSNRSAQLQATVDAVAADFPFREAVALGEPESVLENHAVRAGAAIAIVLDLDGNVLASTGAALRGRSADVLPARVYAPDAGGAYHAVTMIAGIPFETVTVPVRAPVTIAWAIFGFPIDRQLAVDIGNLTGLHASIVRFEVDNVEVFASTLPNESREIAVSGIYLGRPDEGVRSLGGEQFLTSVRPFLAGPAEVYVALQLSMRDATASYRSIRSILLLITSVSLLLAIGGAFWIARMVTRPVRDLAAAARRMREGIYTQALNIDSSDELGDLAAGFNSMQEAIADRERHIFHIAHHDSLSGLPTRDLVVCQLREKISEGAQLAVVNLALSRFDGIVSSLGHRTADEVIKLVAGVLRRLIEEGQCLGHLNHQEFIVVLPSCGVEQAIRFVERVTDTLRAGVVVKGANISLQARAGIAVFPDHSADAAELLRCAAIARNDAQYRLDPAVEYRLGQEDRAVQLTRIVGEFPRALQNNELELHFQPRIDCATRQVVGAEALVRWRHPELGLLPPAKFVEAIEQAGSIAHLTRWALRNALQCCASWRAHGIDIGIAVNISVDDLVDEYLPYFMLELTARHGLKPGDVTLEVTESAIMHNIQMSLAVVSCMRELGFRVAIDDFGTGQSALAQLKRMPVDELKIDKSFVLNMSNSHDEAIVRATIDLAHEFGLHVVAEGVETAQSMERLQTLGCEYAQGYFISKPLAQAEFPSWVRSWSQTHGSDIVSIVAAERGPRMSGVG
jgi:diguanylate cyclase (GGDEF)-like protein